MYAAMVHNNIVITSDEDDIKHIGVPYIQISSIPQGDGTLIVDYDNGILVRKKIAPSQELIQQKYDEVKSTCQQAIYNGFDAEVETGTEHFSLKNEDQINLQTANEAIKSGAMDYPYHSDGNLCRLFKADEITTLANAAVQHKLYHTTYCNHLMRWIDRVETIDELNQIYYGADLPEDLKKNMEQVMAGVKTSV